MEARVEAESVAVADPSPERVDLNRAGAAELEILHGIGPKLAARIVAYRDANGPFLFEEDVTQVSGVGEILFGQLADRLTVTLPSAAELSSGEPPSLAETFGRFAEGLATEAKVAEVPAETTAPVEAIRVPPPEPFAEEGPESVPETVLAVAKEPEGEDQAAAPTPIPEGIGSAPEPAPQDPAKERGRFSWFWTALLGAVFGGIFGMMLSLLVFAGINGSVDLGRSDAVRGVNGRLNQLNTEIGAVQQDVSALQGNVEGIRQRVEVLSGLTARMEQAEETLATFTKEIQALQADTEALVSSMDELDAEVGVMGETLDAVEEQTEKATTFFERLQDLMREVFGDAVPGEPGGGS